MQIDSAAQLNGTNGPVIQPSRKLVNSLSSYIVYSRHSLILSTPIQHCCIGYNPQSVCLEAPVLLVHLQEGVAGGLGNSFVLCPLLAAMRPQLLRFLQRAPAGALNGRFTAAACQRQCLVKRGPGLGALTCLL